MRGRLEEELESGHVWNDNGVAVVGNAYKELALAGREGSISRKEQWWAQQQP